jgi:DNA-binding protein HU-beta
MNRRELIKSVAVQCDTDVRTVDEIFRGLTDVITAVVSKGEPVAISGFAKFAKVERPARMGRNPATGEAIKIKASKKARITALKGFKDAVMTPSQAPKLSKGVWPLAEPAAKPAAKKAAAKPAARKTAAKPAAKKATPARSAATRTTRKAAPKAAARRTTRSR